MSTAVAPRRTPRLGLLVWTGLALAGSVALVLLVWSGHSTDPSSLPASRRLTHATVVLNSAILVFREGLECILVLAAVTAGFRGANQSLRRPIAVGGSGALAAGVATWFFVVWLIGRFHGGEFDVQAATGLPSLLVLLLVMNWFFHRIYWTGWISSHNKRKRSLQTEGHGRLFWGLVLLGFTSVYRESFEIVIFLQNLRELYGASVVLEGVTIGLLFTAAAGTTTFALNQRLPYKKMLIATGALLLFVLLVSVGEEVAEMQLAGWIGTTALPGITFPGWAGTWFSLFANWQTVGAQVGALTIVLGSYAAAQYLRVWRPRRRLRAAAAQTAAEEPSVRSSRPSSAPKWRSHAASS